MTLEEADRQIDYIFNQYRSIKKIYGAWSGLTESEKAILQATKKASRERIHEIFHSLSWEDQIQLAVWKPDYDFDYYLTEEQLVPYRLMK